MIIENIKNKITEQLGSSAKIMVYGSRNKNEEYSGVIQEVYDQVFIVKLINDDIKSFSYVDVLTKTVQIIFL